jgi:hypothetical protein
MRDTHIRGAPVVFIAKSGLGGFGRFFESKTGEGRARKKRNCGKGLGVTSMPRVVAPHGNIAAACGGTGKGVRLGHAME